MAYHYAKYVERLAENARKTYNIPLYVNAAMNSRGRKPGEYPSAGPLAHLADIWRCVAPDIDILAPDIYDTGFKGWAKQYALDDNPLFHPRVTLLYQQRCACAIQFWRTSGRGFQCVCHRPGTTIQGTRHITSSFALVNQMMPLLLKYRARMSLVVCF